MVPFLYVFQSLEENQSLKKGIKLDFKRTDILQESLEIVQKNLQRINFPLWINADIVAGPKIVDPNEFLQMADLYVPQATVSPGNFGTYLKEK